MLPNSVIDRSVTAPDRNGDPGNQLRNCLNERRNTRRAPLRWTVYVVAGHSTHPFRTETRDISMDGFYCVMDRPITAGERIECDILVPTHNSLAAGTAVYLRCRATVVRVEQTGTPGHFGVACAIEDYTLLYGSVEQTAPAIRSGIGS